MHRRARSGFELGDAERLTPLQALSVVTLGSASLFERDDELGSIEVGKYADFTILEDSPLRVDPRGDQGHRRRRQGRGGKAHVTTVATSARAVATY